MKLEEFIASLCLSKISPGLSRCSSGHSTIQLTDYDKPGVESKRETYRAPNSAILVV